MELEFALRKFQAKPPSKFYSLYLILFFSIGVYVGSGSRNETLQTTGTSYLLNKMALRGTTSKSKSELHESIENMGAKFSSHADREFNRFGMSCFSNDASKVVGLLGDMLTNNAMNSSEFELLKQEVSAEHEDNHNRY